MANPYTRRLAADRLDTPGQKVVYTQNSGKVVILRDIVMGTLSQQAQNVRCYLTTGSLNIDLLHNPSQPANTSTHLELRQELLAGDTVSIQNGTDPITVLLTGYVLEP